MNNKLSTRILPLLKSFNNSSRDFKQKLLINYDAVQNWHLPAHVY